MMRDILGIIVIAFGLGFDFIGCLGLLRFSDVYTRLQASTKCITFGTCAILFGAFIMIGLSTAGVKCLLALLFLLFTSPTASHALARASRKAGI